MPTLRHCESADDLHGTVKIGYEVHNGDAAASWVVFVAGVAAPRGMWDRQVAALAPTTGAVTVDNRGIGDSDVPAGGYSTEAMAADVLTVVADVVPGGAAVHVVGHSLGAMISCKVAGVLAAEKRLASLTLLSGSLGGWFNMIPPITAKLFRTLPKLATASTAHRRADADLDCHYTDAYVAEHRDDLMDEYVTLSNSQKRFDEGRQRAKTGEDGHLAAVFKHRVVEIAAGDAAAADRFRRRPALCAYAKSPPSADVALLSVANSAAYLFRLWPLFLSRLLYASDSKLRPLVWIGELPKKLSTAERPACLASALARSARRRTLESFYDGDEKAIRHDATSVSNHYIKVPAALAARAPDTAGLFYVDLDAAAAWPWAATTASKKRRAFQRSVHDVNGSGVVEHARAFDVYSLWHSILEEADLGGCVRYGGELWRDLTYNEAKQTTPAELAARSSSRRALMGCFHVLPDERRVHYERAGSAFAKADEAALLACVGGATCAWRHATGITPLLSAAARAAWLKDLEGLAGTKVFLDLNWRPALGTLEDLWHAAVAKALGDEACAVDTLVVSLTQLRLVAKLVGVADVPEAMSAFEQRDGHSALGRGGAAAGAVVPETDACWPTLLADAREKLAATYAGAKKLKLACCFKTRDAATGLQKRWSVLASATGLATTFDCPVLHTPKDECGGGSRLRAPLRGEPTSPRLVPCPSLGAGAAPPPPPPPPPPAASNAALDGALATVARGKVVAILRAKNATRHRAGVELANLGCSALEVTLDSVEFERVLSTLVARVGDFCCVGVGTVQDAADVPRVAALGAKFALSPFNPPGMIQ
ncbi:10-hydroxy-9-(phosphonooxy)octadecanoate phosphatase [Aureococcus anophagefferens]|nr:10-hydroxy-9-(phosphonooxy)octadecanoate phosphatase [Aureococcus anophagefferens]